MRRPDPRTPRPRPAPRPPASSCPALRSPQNRKRPARGGGVREERLASKKDSCSLRPKSGKRGGGRQRRSREWLFLRDGWP
ncbi:Voltage-Dependent L-Type Calcium Channel Subunit Alpha-1S [Manis pentadactyla]|nr:Voltage-Dependent L-Type Calcium Channel Subunit Alpha-1S [Manis pentadactyla]